MNLNQTSGVKHLDPFGFVLKQITGSESICIFPLGYFLCSHCLSVKWGKMGGGSQTHGAFLTSLRHCFLCSAGHALLCGAAS